MSAGYSTGNSRPIFLFVISEGQPTSNFPYSTKIQSSKIRSHEIFTDRMSAFGGFFRRLFNVVCTPMWLLRLRNERGSQHDTWAAPVVRSRRYVSHFSL